MNFRTIFVAAALSIAAITTNAQNKIGHINSNDLLMAMPERLAAEKKLEDFAKQLESQLTSMSMEYEKKVTDYQANAAVMSEPVKEAKAEEIGDLERRIREFQRKAQESIQNEEAKLMEPLIKKAQDAIKAVAEANKYTYVFDSSVGVMLHYPDGDNILPLVKKHLNLTDTPAAE